MTLRKQLEIARLKLAAQPAAELEAEILLAHALESPRSFLYANPEIDLPSQRIDHFRRLVRRRAGGEPIAYITGHREFWSLRLRVTPDVLIPRHETELLVESALQRLPVTDRQRIADIGTGSGAIALAIASERPACEIHATDVSPAAISLATENAQAHGLGTVRFHQGSWCEPLNGKFNMVLSNPPYIGQGDPHLSQGDLRFEPELALTPGHDALSAFQVIAEQASGCLLPGGTLMFEHGTEQASGISEILLQAGYTNIETLQDLAGLERVTLGSLSG